MRILIPLITLAIAGTPIASSISLAQTSSSNSADPQTQSPATPQTQSPAIPVPPLFGQELLRLSLPTTGEALERAVSAKSYRLGPGDRIAISIWRPGKPPNQFDVIIPLEGKLFLPTIGEIAVAGRTLEQLKVSLTEHLSKRLPGFQVSLLLTGLRSFRVLVTGEVNRPGYLTANAVTRLSEVVAAARITPIGSLRSIKLRDASGNARIADLYNFLVHGHLSENPLVSDGQSITIMRGFGVVEVRGAVGRPGLFEIKKGETVKDLLLYAGGLNDDAYGQKGELFRLRHETAGMENRKVIPVHLERAIREPASAENAPLTPGDILTVYSLAHFRGGKVQVLGQVRQPGEFELVNGMQLSDLIFRAGGLLPDADLERVQLERIAAGQKVVMPLNLAKLLLEGEESQNVRLEFGDIVIVPSMLALAKVVFVEGRVAKPGGFAWRQNETVSTLLTRAGGVVLEAKMPEGSTDPAQAMAPADLIAAYIERLSPDGKKIRIKVDLQKLLVHRDLNVDAKLQPGDVLVVPGKLAQVFVQGFVEKPGAFSYEPNRAARHYVGLASPKPTAELQKVAVRRLDGSLSTGLDAEVGPGDAILVPEKRVSAVLQFLGLIVPVLQFITGR